MRQTTAFERIATVIAITSVILLGAISLPTIVQADTLGDLYGTTYDKADVYDAGNGNPTSSEISSPRLFSFSSTTISPMSFSNEMLYFCKYESGCNYNQGLSSGDGYHAMGYFQFDNRYGLGSFLEAVYNYDPTTFSALATIGNKYNWDVSGITWKDGSFTTLGNDLNTAWHAAYAANPSKFSLLQNGWAYQQYYASSDGIRGSLEAMGIDIDSRADCVKGLCWGLSNLFGKGGGASCINADHYYGANWFIKNSGVNNSMSDTEFVTTLCNYVINNVSIRYPYQSEYWKGWQNRYRNELADCLRYLSTETISYTVSFNANGGKGSKASESMTYGTAKALTKNAFSRTDYTFTGWNTKADGTGTSYSDGSSVKNLSSTSGTIITLYAQWKVNATPMYRLYNPNSGEHFYTANAAEKDYLVSLTWHYEGIGWTAPASSSTPVYRLYNPNAGDHFYTESAAEKDYLVSLTWHYEGIGWYSAGSDGVPLYRQYNPYAIAGTHNYTTNKYESDYLVSLGWHDEGIGWYGI